MEKFEEERYVKSDFSKQVWRDKNFVECHFIGCNLSLTKIQRCRFQNVQFEECKLMGVSFCDVEPLLLELHFLRCGLKMCNFSDLALKGSSFIECQVFETHFSNTNLSKADFSGSDLRGSLFHHTNLQEANFVDAVNFQISPTTNKLKKAQFSVTEALSLLDEFGIILS